MKNLGLEKILLYGIWQELIILVSNLLYSIDNLFFVSYVGKVSLYPQCLTDEIKLCNLVKKHSGSRVFPKFQWRPPFIIMIFIKITIQRQMSWMCQLQR